MGLRLSRDQRKKLQSNSNQEYIPSINQTSSFTRDVRMFLNIEIKKENSGTDPLVQLGVWIAAEYKKRASEGWDTTMPVLALTISWELWDLYIVYQPETQPNQKSELVS